MSGALGWCGIGFALAMVACTGSKAPTPSGQAAGDAPKPPAAAAADPTPDVLRRVCTASCAGPMARIAVFRDDSGQAKRLRFDGDISSCSHPPRVYFDEKGAQTLTIPNRPVAAGSPESEEFARQQADETKGLTEAETVHCPD